MDFLKSILAIVIFITAVLFIVSYHLGIFDPPSPLSTRGSYQTDTPHKPIDIYVEPIFLPNNDKK